MGCCFSHEEEDFVRRDYVAPQRSGERILYARTRPTPTTTSSFRSSYDCYDNQYRAVPAPRIRSVPIHNQISKPNVRAVVIKPTQEFKPKPGALYGEYKCGCGYFWVSRLSWRDKYQKCKRCKADVRPRNQRELRPSDFARSDDLGLEHQHPQNLCEMCEQVGGYCGKYKFGPIVVVGCS